MRKLTSQFNDKSIPELNKEVEAIRNEIVISKLDYTVNAPKDSNMLIKKRQKLAVLLTIKRKKELENK
jgi:ribosomal protein L29